MCLIIEAKKEIDIPKFVFEDMFVKNPDGYGFMYAKDGKVEVDKENSKDLDVFYDKYKAYREYSPYIHLRMRTHGDVNDDMAHPFDCGKGVWMMHNGVMGEFQGEDKSKSDTWYFANEWIRPLLESVTDVEEFIASPHFANLVRKLIGSGQRVVMLSPKTRLLFNASSWHTVTNGKTQCAGLRVSNTYAWDLHTERAPVVHRGGYYDYSGWHNWEGEKRQRQHFDNVSHIHTRPSKPDDPEHSFRDQQDDLWVFCKYGWVREATWRKLEQGELTLAHGSQEVVQSPPTFPKTNESESKSDGGESIGEQRIPHETAYYDWIMGVWDELDYDEIYDRVKQEPQEAADFIAYILGKEIK